MEVEKKMIDFPALSSYTKYTRVWRDWVYPEKQQETEDGGLHPDE
jgi:hypothetical protein